MVAVVSSPSICISSGSSMHRTGLIPLVIGLTTGWIFVGLWTALALITISHNIYWALVLCGSTTAFGGFLLYMTWTTILESFTQYTLEMSGTEAVLTSYNRLRKRSKILMMLLDDITFAEYYPYRDSCSLILHTGDREMEVPLWPMGARSQDIIDYLQGRGVRVINVQSDEMFPH
jgi:hypothetical protein